jgi:hypothetical protein
MFTVSRLAIGETAGWQPALQALPFTCAFGKVSRCARGRAGDLPIRAAVTDAPLHRPETPRGFAALLMPDSAAHQRDNQNDQQNQAEGSATDPIYVSEHWCD